MGFFDRLFGNQEKKTISLEVAHIPEFVRQHTKKQELQAEQGIAQHFSEIKHSLTKVNAAVSELNNATVESDNKRAVRVVNTAKANVVRQLAALGTRLQPPTTVNAQSAYEYVTEAQTLLHKEGKTIGKNIAYTRLLVKNESQTLGECMKDLATSLDSLQEHVQKHNSLFLTEAIIAETKRLEQAHKHICFLESEQEKTRSTIKELQSKQKEISSAIARLNASDAAKELARLEEQHAHWKNKRADMHARLTNLFLSIEKPVRRFNTLVQSKRLFVKNKEQEYLLHALVHDPLLALKRDPKGENIKALLKEVQQAMEDNIVSLKQKEHEKKHEQLSRILHTNFSEQFFWDNNTIEKELVRIEKAFSQNPAKKQLEQHTKEKSRVIHEIEKAQQELQKTQETIQNRKTIIVEQQAALEKKLCNAFNQNITIV